MCGIFFIMKKSMVKTFFAYQHRLKLGYNLNNSTSLSYNLIFTVPEMVMQNMWFDVFINFYTKTLLW